MCGGLPVGFQSRIHFWRTWRTWRGQLPHCGGLGRPGLFSFGGGGRWGGGGGRGVASCRAAAGWSAPAFFTLGGGSFGLQIGAQSTDFVMLFMNKDGLNSLLSDQFTLGADASVAAGPVGRQAGAATDLKLNAQILSYSRSRGLFAGLELKGVVIKADKDDMRDVYGAGVTAKEGLHDNKGTAPIG